MNPERSLQTYQSVELVPLLLEVVEGSAGGEVGPVVRLTLEAHVLKHPAGNRIGTGILHCTLYSTVRYRTDK